MITIFCLAGFFLPRQLEAGDGSEPGGLQSGEKDVTRIDSRLSPQDERIDSDRIRDQRQGREEKGLRREMREEQQRLAADEQVRFDRARLRKEQEVVEKRRRIAADEFERKKKRATSFSE